MVTIHTNLKKFWRKLAVKFGKEKETRSLAQARLLNKIKFNVSKGAKFSFSISIINIETKS